MYNWQSLLGKFELSEEKIAFHGEAIKLIDVPGASIGNLVCDQRFSGGYIEATVRFLEVTAFSACQIIASYRPETRAFLTAGIGAGSGADSMFVVRTFIEGRWHYHGDTGVRSLLESNRDYHLKVEVVGSRLSLRVDGVEVIAKVLPFTIPHNQAGIWCQDVKTIEIRDFSISATMPTAFVVMQFSKPYNELYTEVIEPVCDEFQIKAVRADEAYGPGLIVSDIARQISESSWVIAEITPANPNVYYEVGYAHALGKPTILIAEAGTKLPFDVSPFRTLFYENTIDGKRRIEEGFRKHLNALQKMVGLTGV